MRRKFIALAACTLLAGTGVPATADAQQGLTADPQSPAGVEYAVPLDSARGHGSHSGGASGGSSNSGGSSSQPLFGNGIKPAPGSAAGGGSNGSNGGKHRGSSSGAGGGAGARGGKSKSGGAESIARSTVAPVPASANYSTTGPVAGLIAAILLAGGGLGLFLRLRGRRS